MPRYIDADALLKHEIEADRMGAMLVVGKGYILEAPEIDAVEVVRCKDCKHYILGPFGMGCVVHFNHKTDVFTHKPDDYCSYGEKMEDKP